MRAFILAAFLLTACRQESPATDLEADPKSGQLEVFASGPRDRLCLKPDGTAGLITYASTGDTNCSVRGRVDEPSHIRPNGDESCSIAFERSGNIVRLTEIGAACAFYCGPGATMEGKIFARNPQASAPQPTIATDLAGDPLC